MGYLTDMLHRIFQLKVGGAPSDDIARIHAVRAMLDVKVSSLPAVFVLFYTPVFCFGGGVVKGS